MNQPEHHFHGCYSRISLLAPQWPYIGTRNYFMQNIYTPGYVSSHFRSETDSEHGLFH